MLHDDDISPPPSPYRRRTRRNHSGGDSTKEGSQGSNFSRFSEDGLDVFSNDAFRNYLLRSVIQRLMEAVSMEADGELANMKKSPHIVVGCNNCLIPTPNQQEHRLDSSPALDLGKEAVESGQRSATTLLNLWNSITRRSTSGARPSSSPRDGLPVHPNWEAGHMAADNHHGSVLPELTTPPRTSTGSVESSNSLEDVIERFQKLLQRKVQLEAIPSKELHFTFHVLLQREDHISLRKRDYMLFELRCQYNDLLQKSSRTKTQSQGSTTTTELDTEKERSIQERVSTSLYREQSSTTQHLQTNEESLTQWPYTSPNGERLSNPRQNRDSESIHQWTKEIRGSGDNIPNQRDEIEGHTPKRTKLEFPYSLRVLEAFEIQRRQIREYGENVENERSKFIPRPPSPVIWDEKKRFAKLNNNIMY